MTLQSNTVKITWNKGFFFVLFTETEASFDHKIVQVTQNATNAGNATFIDYFLLWNIFLGSVVSPILKCNYFDNKTPSDES